MNICGQRMATFLSENLIKPKVYTLKVYKTLPKLTNALFFYCFCFFLYLSQTLFGNPKGPVELGNPNTCTETKLCLTFILFRLKK